MSAAVSPENEQMLVDLAVADAPEMTDDQILQLRRVLKPYLSGSSDLVTVSNGDTVTTHRRAA